MSDQQASLFDNSPDPANDPYNGTTHPKRPCTPAPLGSGPVGETCGTCRHRVRVEWHASVYRKCNHMAHAWTRGAGSDIKAAWKACRRWEPSSGIETTHERKR